MADPGGLPLKCPHCERRFAKPGPLRLHAKVHEPRQCYICKKTLRDAEDLKKHLRKHTPQEREAHKSENPVPGPTPGTRSHKKRPARPINVSADTPEEDIQSEEEHLDTPLGELISTGARQRLQEVVTKVREVIDLRFQGHLQTPTPAQQFLNAPNLQQFVKLQLIEPVVQWFQVRHRSVD